MLHSLIRMRIAHNNAVRYGSDRTCQEMCNVILANFTGTRLFFNNGWAIMADKLVGIFVIAISNLQSASGQPSGRCYDLAE